METLDINLFPNDLEDDYKKEQTRFIATYKKYKSGNFFSSGGWESRPDIGKAEWDERFPEGFQTWARDTRILTAIGQQLLINKVNELVKKVNELENKK